MMAPTVEPEVVLIVPWPIFTVFGVDGHPLVGGKLYTYMANTTNPKPAYYDPYFLSAHANPIVLNDQGQETIWLDGFYRLVLTDAEDVVLWEVPSYSFEVGTTPAEGIFVTGSTDVVVPAVSGESVLQATGVCPLGYRVEAVLARIDATFGSSLGLQTIQIGDAVLQDGWGQIGLNLGLTTGQRDIRRADRPIAATAYTVLLSAIHGRFDSAGSCTIRCYWSSVAGWSS